GYTDAEPTAPRPSQFGTACPVPPRSARTTGTRHRPGPLEGLPRLRPDPSRDARRDAPLRDATAHRSARRPPPRRSGAARPAAAAPPRYRILNLLGRGGMGAVYQAEPRLMRRPVALKVIKAGLTADARAVERFRREVIAAARLAHPNIVTAFDAEQVGGVHFL